MRGWVGIDPGVDGAVAVYRPFASAQSGLRWQIIDIPTTGDPRRELNAAALRDWFRKIDPDHCFLESVTAMPSIPDAKGVRRGMGAASAFRFGAMFGAIKAVLACCDVPYTLVTPQVWKKAHALAGSDKERSRQRALQLFASHRVNLETALRAASAQGSA
jgi:crossover junction endodeoxyribonuclease RuvC